MAILHSFGCHAFLFIMSLRLPPAIFLFALVTSAMMLAVPRKPSSGRSKILPGGVFAFVLVSVGCGVVALDDRRGYEVTSQLVGSAPDELERIFITVQVDRALMDTVCHSFEHSLISAFEANGIITKLSVMPDDGEPVAVADRFFDNREFTTGQGMKKEFAWHTTAAIVQTFVVDVIGRESEAIHTVTEERERQGHRVD